MRRDPNGGLWGDPDYGVVTTAQNVAGLLAEGVDLRAALVRDIGSLGQLELSVLATFVTKRNRQAAENFPVVRCRGEFGDSCAHPNPGVRFTQRGTWRYRDFSAGYRWRFIDSSELDEQSLDLDRDGVSDLTACLPALCRIGTAHYVDVWFGWRPTEITWLAGFEVLLGVENLADRQPPEVGSYWGPTSGNTFPDTYDPLGRVVTLSVSREF